MFHVEHCFQPTGNSGIHLSERRSCSRTILPGEPVPPADYFKGTIRDHLWGIVGGAIWAVGMTFNIIALELAGAARAYGLGQGATLVAALWGVFIWKEFREAPSGTNAILALMFLGYLAGLALIVLSGAQ